MATVKDRMLSRWRRPLPQVLLVGFVLLSCPGMYNAIQGIGGGGGDTSNQAIVSKANAAVYVFYSVVALFGGALINKFGPRVCLSIGCLSYGLYIGSLWSLSRTGNEGFVIFSGCMLGIGAAFLWSTQGAVTMSYPVESERARAFRYQLIIYTMGSTIGGLVALADTVANNELTSVNNVTYIAFIIIVVAGSVAALTLANPAQVRRKDGSPVSIEISADWSGELQELGRLLKKKIVWLLIPAFIASNGYYAYFFSMNSFYFSLRGRSLNAAIFWAMQPLGTLFMSSILDMKRVERRKRGLIGLAAITICVCAVWTGGALFQATFDRHEPSPKLDWNFDMTRWGRAFALFISYGFSDAMFATYLAWIIGTRSNDPRILARYSGIYRSVQSAGQAIMFALDATRTRFLIQFSINFVLVAGSLPFLAIVAWTVTSTNYGTEANVSSPIDWEKNIGGGADDHVAAASEIEKVPASAERGDGIDVPDEKDSLKRVDKV